MNIPIPAGTKYSVFVTSKESSDKSTTVGYRIWQIREPEDYFTYDISYLDYDKSYTSELPGPRWDIMAVPKVVLRGFPADNVGDMSVDLYDCNGRYVPSFDNYNLATKVLDDSKFSTTFYINPLPCDSNQICNIRESIFQGYYTMNVSDYSSL